MCKTRRPNDTDSWNVSTERAVQGLCQLARQHAMIREPAEQEQEESSMFVAVVGGIQRHDQLVGVFLSRSSRHVVQTRRRSVDGRVMYERAHAYATEEDVQCGAGRHRVVPRKLDLVLDVNPKGPSHVGEQHGKLVLDRRRPRDLKCLGLSLLL